MGTTIKVRKVATIRPKITTTAIDRHHWLDSLTQDMVKVWKSNETPVTIGINPKIVVIAVSNTGLNRVAPAAITASRSW